ncbi:MAG: hypothetical protein EOM20_02890 [Spartobacteria bacterium]|nr:hypothetical protein [Spartobacteria bacterium]
MKVINQIRQPVVMAVLGFVLGLSVCLAEPVIESFQPGRLTWSGATPGTTNWVEWAAGVTNGSLWCLLTNVLVDSTVMSIDVPFAYRVCETQPTNPLPGSYDLRDYGWDTPVKSQAGNRPDGVPDSGATIGICWGVSATYVFESSLLKQGITMAPNAPESSISCWHLGNAVGTPPMEYNMPCYQYYGDPLEIPIFVTEPRTTFGYLSPDGTNGWGGGQVFWLLDYLLTWTGPVYEVAAPVPVAMMTAHQTLQWTNQHPPTANLIMRGAYMFEPDDYASIAEYWNAAKQAILDYGAIQTYMLVLPADLPGVKGLTFYDSNSVCYYCPRQNLQAQLNHAVTIIGWDDAYPVTNAPADGAWLTKESLGTNCFDGGYAWMAYADQTFMRGAGAFYAVVAGDGAGYEWPGLMTHAGTMPAGHIEDITGIGSIMWGEDSWGYARFNATDGGPLKAIGLFTLNRNETVTIGVYDSVDSQRYPGDLLGRKQVTLDEWGYHLVDLDSVISITGGDDFYVSLEFEYSDRQTTDPLMLCPDAGALSAETYVLQYSNATNDTPEWVAVTNIVEQGAIFLQALFASP